MPKNVYCTYNGKKASWDLCDAIENMPVCRSDFNSFNAVIMILVQVNAKKPMTPCPRLYVLVVLKSYWFFSFKKCIVIYQKRYIVFHLLKWLLYYVMYTEKEISKIG